MKELRHHHVAWLAAHPGRTADWLAAKLADGFHVHHIDDDHFNDAPENLVLIEGTDHSRIHGQLAAISRYVGKNRARLAELREAAAAKAYHVIAETGSKRTAQIVTGIKTVGRVARLHAAEHGLPWPPSLGK